MMHNLLWYSNLQSKKFFSLTVWESNYSLFEIFTIPTFLSTKLSWSNSSSLWSVMEIDPIPRSQRENWLIWLNVHCMFQDTRQNYWKLKVSWITWIISPWFTSSRSGTWWKGAGYFLVVIYFKGLIIWLIYDKLQLETYLLLSTFSENLQNSYMWIIT